MINNRQGGGRRRGRGGQRGQNIGGQPGNRQDNRQRGNAAQLLEKYKNMARDAQLSGDRVQTEYYLQFADHYFRVLSENRARFEDQRPRREHELDDDEAADDDDAIEAGDEQVTEQEEPRRERGERYPRRERDRDRDRDRERRPRERDEEERESAPETIPFDVLPPSIGRDGEDEAAEAEEPRRPRRRTRAPRAVEGDDEIAPAA